MISRTWRGVVKPSETEAYIRHLRDETFARMEAMQGFGGVSLMQREVEDGVEFLVITQWESLSDIHAFAGDDISIAVVPPVAEAMMVRYDRSAAHYEQVAAR